MLGTVIAMADNDGLRERLQKQGEDALGKLAQDLLENPMVTGALTKAFEARERAAAAQEVAMGALNLPSAADLERLTRRLRSVSQRLEGIEDAVDRLDQRLEAVSKTAGIEERLSGIETQIAKLAADVHTLAQGSDAVHVPVPREQERLAVEVEAAATGAKKKRPPAKKKTS